MRQIVVSTTSTGTSNPVVLDHYIAPFQVSIGMAMSSGSDVEIQHTFDNVLNSSLTPIWYTTTAATADEGFLLQENGDQLLQESGYALLTGEQNFAHYIDFPVAAIRLNTIVNGGTVTMTVLQAGMPGQ